MNLSKLFSEIKGNKTNLSTVSVSYPHEEADRALASTKICFHSNLMS